MTLPSYTSAPPPWAGGQPAPGSYPGSPTGQTDPTPEPVAGYRYTPGAGRHTWFQGADRYERRLRRRFWITLAITWGGIVAGIAALWVYVAWWAAVALVVVQTIGLSIGMWENLRGGRSLLDVEGIHPITERTQPALWRLANDVAVSMGVTLPPLYIIESRSPNAFAAPAGLRKRYLVFTTGWLATADAQQTRGVMAHELAHVLNNDSLIMAILLGTYRGLHGAASRAQAAERPRGYRRSHPVSETLAGLGRAVAVIFGLTFRSVSRSREALADLTAARRLGGAEPMVACLRLLLSEAMLARRGEAHGKLPEKFSTHPATDHRVQALLDICWHQATRIE